jgi:hypothetical protein
LPLVDPLPNDRRFVCCLRFGGRTNRLRSTAKPWPALACRSAQRNGAVLPRRSPPGFLRVIVAIAGGWFALRLTGSLNWLFAARAFGLIIYGVVLTSAIISGVWFGRSTANHNRTRLATTMNVTSRLELFARAVLRSGESPFRPVPSTRDNFVWRPLHTVEKSHRQCPECQPRSPARSL